MRRNERSVSRTATTHSCRTQLPHTAAAAPHLISRPPPGEPPWSDARPLDITRRLLLIVRLTTPYRHVWGRRGGVRSWIGLDVGRRGVRVGCVLTTQVRRRRITWRGLWMHGRWVLARDSSLEGLELLCRVHGRVVLRVRKLRAQFGIARRGDARPCQ